MNDKHRGPIKLKKLHEANTKRPVTVADASDFIQSVLKLGTKSNLFSMYLDKKNLDPDSLYDLMDMVMTKIQKSYLYKLNQLKEKKSDGTISDDEEEREEELMAQVESSIDELIAKIKEDANDIGGSFRAPGIIHRVGQLIKAKLNKARIIR